MNTDPSDSTHKIMDDAVIRFIEKDLCHLHFTRTDAEVALPALKEIRAQIGEMLTVEKCYMIISTESGAAMTQESRDYASSEAFDAISIADAILRADYNHEMAANFFIRFNRPNRPVRLFPDREHALAWINGLKDAQAI